jgi:hypothetical protein
VVCQIPEKSGLPPASRGIFPTPPALSLPASTGEIRKQMASAAPMPNPRDRERCVTIFKFKDDFSHMIVR